MVTLTYGSGYCSIDGDGAKIKGIQIRYSGSIEITDKTPETFGISVTSNMILIYPTGEGRLNELFEYKGEFKILSFIIADENAQKVSAQVKKIVDFSENIKTNSEDLTVKSEDLKNGSIIGKRVKRTILKKRNKSGSY